MYATEQITSSNRGKYKAVNSNLLQSTVPCRTSKNSSILLNPRSSSLCPNAPAAVPKIIVPTYPCQIQRVRHHCK